MRKRTFQEIAHYDKLAKAWRENRKRDKWQGDAEFLTHSVFSSYRFCEKWMKSHIKTGESVLDYGCGNGIHSILPAKIGAKVTGVDLSQGSLAIARERAKRERVEKQTTFLLMDCEKMTFPDDSFDMVFDGGTFSSLDIKKAIPELARVLKPDGALLAIETLGHNPLTNMKRRINKLLGRRTGWAVEHILKMDDLAFMRKYFDKVETHFFHLFSLFAFPFLSLPGGISLLRVLEKIDSLLLKIPFLQKYAFKIVIICRNPKSKAQMSNQ
ncbi:MAG: class I SAM-dependent methyltransferase [Candidatus Portnoybacteria bacterium]|nr:class I SAM-dependent methyltransferase [Candidatus Portnoybacteria bacterium]